MKSVCLRLFAVAAIGLALSACSDVPDWVDPTTWMSDKAPPDSGDGKAPDLTDIPGKPATSTPDEQKQVADSLAADRAQASYSAEQLRAGNDTTAPPPPPAPPPGSASDSGSSSVSTPAETTSSEQSASAAPAEAPAPAPSPAPATASTDAGSGFHASAAPPLDPSVSQFASASDVARYQQGSQAASPTAGLAQPSPVSSSSAGGTGPAAVVLFANDATSLNTDAKAKVHEVVEAYQTKGSQGFIRVVGHSSGGAASEETLKLSFRRSQGRANAIARELIKEGVPADKVLVETAGDQAGDQAEIFLQS